MTYSVSFIGSFRKEEHYRIVKTAVQRFKENDIKVNSPSGTEVCDSIDDFVIFESDDCRLTPAEIQKITLGKILSSDAVFVCDLGGYVGRTTCYEIGCCQSCGVPLYFLERPLDLPISVPETQVMSIDDFLCLSMSKKTAQLDEISRKPMKQSENNVLSKEALKEITVSTIIDTLNNEPQKRIVICGSMSFYSDMCVCQSELKKLGVNTIIPKDEGCLPDGISEEEFLLFKKKVSNAYLKKIREKETGAILVYNAPKNGKENYIGANTFVEIAMAFAWSRKIYLYYDIFEPYKDELLAWGCICLNGDLSQLTDNWRCRQNSEYRQLSLDMTLLMEGK